MLKALLIWFGGIASAVISGVIVLRIDDGSIWSGWTLAWLVALFLTLSLAISGWYLTTLPSRDEKRLLKWAAANGEAFTFTSELGVPDAVVLGGVTLFGWHRRLGDEPPENARDRSHWLSVAEKVRAKWGKSPTDNYVTLNGDGVKLAHRLPDFGPVPSCEYERHKRAAHTKAIEKIRKSASDGRIEAGVRMIKPSGDANATTAAASESSNTANEADALGADLTQRQKLLLKRIMEDGQGQVAFIKPTSEHGGFVMVRQHVLGRESHSEREQYCEDVIAMIRAGYLEDAAEAGDIPMSQAIHMVGKCIYVPSPRGQRLLDQLRMTP